jgi:hypothetical protein
MQYFIGLTKTRVPIMKETPRRRITVTSSLFDISTDQLGNREGEAFVTPPTPSTSRFLDRY